MVEERFLRYSTGLHSSCGKFGLKALSVRIAGPIVPGIRVSLFDSQSQNGIYVSLWIESFRRESLDGPHQCSVEGQSVGKMSSIECRRRGRGMFVSSQRISERRNRLLGAVICAPCQRLQ